MEEMEAVARLSARLATAPVAAVTVVDAARRHIVIHGAPADHWHLLESMWSCATSTGQVAAIPDLSVDPLFRDHPCVDGRVDALRACASAPVTVDGEVIGQVQVASRVPWELGTTPAGGVLDSLVDLAGIVGSLVARRRESDSGGQARAALVERNAELAEVNNQLVRARAFDQALLETLPVGVVAADADRQVQLFNRVSRGWHDRADHPSSTPDDIPTRYDLFDSDGTTPLPAHQVPLMRVFDEGAVSDVEVVIAPRGEPARRVSCTGRPVLDPDGNLLGAVVAMADVTAQRRLEEQLRAAALHDNLTGLPNRVLVVDRIDRALTSCTPGPGQVAVLYCDLDGFKKVNDVHGHAVGDEVLVQAAARLSAAVRPGDTVARVGGDEFIVCCAGIDDPAAADLIAARVAEAFRPAVRTSAGLHHVGISVGLAIGRNGISAAALIADADRAMYACKVHGRLATSAT